MSILRRWNGSAWEDVTNNFTNTPTAGGAAYGNGSTVAFTAAGTAGQVLRSNGAAAPTWEGAWTAWVPTWTNLTIGNATVWARYIRIGNTVWYRVRMMWGSTTVTVAPHSFYFSLPVATTALVTGTVWALDVSAGPWSMGVFLKDSYFVFGTSVVSATSPFTWAVGDYIEASGFYEAA